MMFGQIPKMPLDLIIPTLDIAASNEPFDASKFENLVDLNAEGNDDDWQDLVNPESIKYCENQENKFKQMYSIANRNKDILMDRTKIRHDRNIKKFSYEVGDLVLADHVKLKKGVCSGLAHKYYGPLVVVGKHPNNVNYVVKNLQKKKSKNFLIHKNRLKRYFGHFEDYVNKDEAANDSAIIVEKSSDCAKPRKKRKKAAKTKAAAQAQTGEEVPIDVEITMPPCQVDEHVTDQIAANPEEPSNDTNNSKNSNQEDHSFRPYYTKKTNRVYRKKIETDENMGVRRSSRNKKAPDRYQGKF